jgi:decaprenylphospho-beta-D-erythro-pentofuranosid-2-ulose 2-reductase
VQTAASVNSPRRVVFLGATSGMGRALARLFSARGDQLFLLGNELPDLEQSAADLRVRGASGDVGFALCDLSDSKTFPAALEAAKKALGSIDVVVVTAAMYATQDELVLDPALRERLLTIDFTNTVLFCELAKNELLSAGGGTLCVFSSVAGERGRKPVALYGAAKAGLTRYLEALDHTHHKDGLRVVTVKPGFVKTAMTDGLKPPPFAGEPDAVAATVLRAIDRGTPVVYAPLPWAGVMTVIRALPRFVMRRVGF